MTSIGTLHAFPKNRVKLDLHPESEPAKRMRMRTKKWMLLTFTWSSVLLLLFANLRGLGHFRSFSTNYGFLTSGKDRMLVFTPNSVKKYILWDAKCNAAKTEKAKWAQIWSLHARFFCIKSKEFCSLRIDGVQALTWQTSYKANKFTRKMFYSSACKFQICIWLPSCYGFIFACKEEIQNASSDANGHKWFETWCEVCKSSN